VLQKYYILIILICKENEDFNILTITYLLNHRQQTYFGTFYPEIFHLIYGRRETWNSSILQSNAID